MRVYNGLRFEGNIMELHNELQLLKSKLRPAINTFLKEMMLRVVVGIYDIAPYVTMKELKKLYPHIDFDKSKEFYFAARDVVSVFYERDMGEINMMVYPLENEILMYPFAPNIFMQAILTHSAFQEYGFWDNTDALSNVTKEEWKEREKKWSKLFENAKTFSDIGFSFVFMNELPIYLEEDFSIDKYDDELTRLEKVQRSLKGLGKEVELKQLKPLNYQFWFKPIKDYVKQSEEKNEALN